jgi:hypothetical protein
VALNTSVEFTALASAGSTSLTPVCTAPPSTIIITGPHLFPFGTTTVVCTALSPQDTIVTTSFTVTVNLIGCPFGSALVRGKCTPLLTIGYVRIICTSDSICGVCGNEHMNQSSINAWHSTSGR